MTGDSDNEVGNAGGQPAPHERVEGNSLRPFKSWASGYEAEPSMWSRVRHRIAGLFARRSHDPSAGLDGQSFQLGDPGKSAGNASVAPPGDFRFPWTRPGVEAPAPASDERFKSVDDALPASDRADERFQPPTKPRLFGLFQEQTQAPEADAFPIEIHEERIDAAANALEHVGERQFDIDGRSKPKDSSFANVDAALPTENSLPLIYAPGPPVEPVESTDEFEIAAQGALAPAPYQEEPTLEMEPRASRAKAFLRGLFGAGRTEAAEVSAKEAEAVKTSAVFLLAKFRAFYNEIIRFRHQHSEFTAGFATAVMAADGTDSGPDAAAEGLSKRLAELLDLQMAEAKWMGGEAGERYPDAHYAMAALADEIFTHSEWEGKSAWPKFSLEKRVYKTHAAEVELFKRIDRLLKDSPDTAVARDLGRVYLLVLAAGFQGKWRPFGLTRPIAEYRRRLYEYIHKEDPLLLFAAERRVFPEATARILEGHAVARFSTAQRWAAILVFLVVSYTVIAHIAWSRASADLKDVTTRIKSDASTKVP